MTNKTSDSSASSPSPKPGATDSLWQPFWLHWLISALSGTVEIARGTLREREGNREAEAGEREAERAEREARRDRQEVRYRKAQIRYQLDLSEANRQELESAGICVGGAGGV